jgi:hypothetical protein
MRVRQYLSCALCKFVGYFSSNVAFLGGVKALLGVAYRERASTFHGFLYRIRVTIAYVGRTVPVYCGAYYTFGFVHGLFGWR